MIITTAIIVLHAYAIPARTASSPSFGARSAQAAPVEGVTGLVHDSGGATVPGAIVIARTASTAEQQTVTGPDGRFSFATIGSSSEVVVIVRARGFAETRQT